MLLLIPFSLVLLLTVSIVAIGSADAYSANTNEYDQTANSIVFHHELVVRREEQLNGLVNLREANYMSPLEGLSSFIFRSGDETYILTWPRRFSEGNDFRAPVNRENDSVTAVLEAAKIRMEARGLRGQIDHGELVASETMDMPGSSNAGAGVEYRVGNIVMPFKPPAVDRSSIIVTFLSGN